jgi:hypothetical protein
MTRPLADAIFVQGRAYGGKRSSTSASLNKAADASRWLDLQIRAYRTFKERVSRYEGHRPRLAYAVRVYLKDQPL